ncbi:hypothetical protein JZ751_011813 [Albula glossodonta]|uniref:Uncharacterized protein n=1 Tax=Albula glossodonta TaxID=121402 RepID=A0A8T2PQX5_9TELE|nr:hypothetical protein JZ751_011813 [Albula glossodonta]
MQSTAVIRGNERHTENRGSPARRQSSNPPRRQIGADARRGVQKNSEELQPTFSMCKHRRERLGGWKENGDPQVVMLREFPQLVEWRRGDHQRGM